MTVSGNAVPVTWPELLRADVDLLRDDLAAIDETPAQLAVVRPPWLLSNRFGAPTLTLAQAAVVFGPAACHGPLATLIPLLPMVLHDFDGGITATNRVPAQHLLAFFNTAQCCGVDVPTAATVAERSWPERLVPFARLMSEGERQTAAFAAIVAGQSHLVPTMIGGGELEVRFTPGVTFDFDVQGFIRYLAVACRERTDFTDVEPAWRNFVERFPHKRAAGTLDWADLLYAARIVDGLRPEPSVGTIADALYRLVSSY